MKYLPLIWAGLWRKRARTILTALSVAAAFMLHGALNGAMASFDEYLRILTDQSEIWVVSRVNMDSGLPLAHLARIEAVEGVERVDFGVFFGGYWQTPENSIGGNAVDFGRWDERAGENFVIRQADLETMQRTRTGVLIGKELAERYGWRVGDRLPLRSGWPRKDGSYDWVFDIVGIYDVTPNAPFDASQIYINWDYFDEARAIGNGIVTLFTARAANPDDAGRIAAEIDALFANSGDETLSRSFADAIRADLNRIVNVRLLINVVLSAVFFTLLFVTANTMMQSFRERIPELAVLKTYGYGDAIVTGLVAAEAAILCIVSALVGMAAAAAVLFPLIWTAFNLEGQPMEPSVVLIGVAFAAALAALSALPPAWRARRLNVVDALAGR